MCTPVPPHTPLPQLLCLALLCIIPDENIICLLSVCLSHTNPNPQKWQLSYTGIMLPPHPPIQPRKINYKGLGLAFFCHCAPERWVDGKKQLRDDREEERERARKKRREEITLSSARWWQQNIVEERASRHLLFTMATGLSCCFLFPSLFLHLTSHSSFFSSRCSR